MGLSPQYYDGCTDDVLNLYAELEDRIIADIVRRIIKTGDITETAKWQIRQTQQMGFLYDDIIKEVAKSSGKTEQTIKKMFENAGVETVNNDNRLHIQAGKSHLDIRQSDLDKLNAKDIEYNGKMYSEYEISQMLRKKEREIRALKREAVAYDTAIMETNDEELKSKLKDDFTNTSEKLKDKEQSLANFTKETGIKRDKFREQVQGFNRSVSSKSTWANKKSRNDLTSDNGNGKLKSSNQENNQIQWLPKGEKLSNTQFKELRDYAKDKGVTIQGIKKSDIDIELTKEVIDKASKMLDKYPALKGNERKPFTISIESTMLNNDFGSTTPNITHIIQLNENAFRNKQKLEYQKLLADKWFAKGTSYKSIVVHEIGHLIGDIYNIDSLTIAKQVLNIDSTSELLLKIKEELSTYAGSFADGSKIISEVFSAFYTGDRNEFIDKFMEEVNKIVKEKK